jgi:Carboxypeptidase regulatory-like domain/TonB dependent receptor-like, beta-barrel
MRKCIRLVLLAFVSLLVSISPLASQTISGSLRGTVTDESGSVMPGVTIELTGASQIGGTQSATTDRNGQYRFQNLTPGVYTLKATLGGFKNVVRDGIRVEVGRTFDVDFKLEVGSLEETITVTAESPLVDGTSTALTTNYNEEMLKNTPITRFSVFDMFQFTPGVSPSQIEDSNASSAYGSNTNENQYQIDGTNITAPTNGQMWPFPNTDIVEEFELIGVGAPAEYGNMQGAVFNVVTKSGSNNLRGLMNWFSQYQALTDNNTPDEPLPFHRDRFNDATVQIGGPIQHDRLWWFGSYQYRRDLYSDPGTPPDLPTRDMQDRVFGKLTWQVKPTHTLMFAYHNDHWRLPTTITTTRPHEASSMNKGHNPTPTATWHALLNDRTTFELRYGGFYNWSSNQGLIDNLTTPGVYDQGTGVYSVNAQAYSFSANAPRLTSISSKLTRAMSIRGQLHEFGVGLQFQDGGTMSESVWPGGMQITLNYGQPLYIDVRDPSFSGGNMRTYGVFLDDGWAVADRIQVNAGVRFDVGKGWIQEMPQLDAARNEIGTVPGIDDLVDWKSVSPRLGLNMTLRENGDTVMRVSYGRYYQGVTTNIYSALSPAQAVTRRFGWNAATGRYDILQRVTDPRGSYTVDPDLKQPYTDQYTIGVDHELAANLAVGVSYIHKRAEDFIGRIDTASVWAPATVVDPDNGNVLTVYNRTSPAQDIRVVLTNPNPETCAYCTEAFRQRYNGVLLSLTKRMSNRWQAVASLTLAKVEGLHSGSSSGQSSAAGTFGDDPNELINAFGLLGLDRNFMWKLQGSYQMPWDILLSSNWIWQAGRLYARKLNMNGFADGRQPAQGSVTIFLEPRDGSLRMDSQNYINLRAEKQFRFGGSRRVTAMVDVINLLNADTPLTLISESVNNVNFAKPETRFDPRQAMVGVRFQF